jgi:hypothetical protein
MDQQMETNGETIMLDGKRAIAFLCAFILAVSAMCTYSISLARSASLELERSRRDEVSMRIRLKRIEASYGTARREAESLREEIEDIKAVINTY